MTRLRRRWLLFARGECEVEGCHEPAQGFPYFGSFCAPHLDEHVAELHRKAAKDKFDHEVRVTAEAMRRVMPELADAVKGGGG